MYPVRRRQFLLCAAAVPAAPLARAQTAAAPPVFGILLAFAPDAGTTFTRPLRADRVIE